MPDPVAPTVLHIKTVVCARYGVTLSQMEGCCRRRRLVRARWVAMFLARKLTRGSLPWIGRAFGHRDHTTVLHGVRRIQEAIQHDKLLEFQIEDMAEQVRFRSRLLDQIDLRELVG